MSLDDRQKTFIGYLLNLAEESKEDRGALADLRSGLGRQPGQMARVHKHVVPYLPDKPYQDRWYYLTATLFGAFPEHRNGRSLGSAFHRLKQERNSDSIEARFIALLNAHPDDLDEYARHAVSLLKAGEEPLDWFRLFEDLLQWDHPDGHVQLRWARDFYKTAAGATGSESRTFDQPIHEEEAKGHE